MNRLARFMQRLCSPTGWSTGPERLRIMKEKKAHKHDEARYYTPKNIPVHIVHAKASQRHIR
jgi:hypothetical protein